MKKLIGLICLIGLVVFALGAKTASASALTKPFNNLGLVAYYPFNEGTSTKAGDFSGKGNTGTLTNMEATDWVQGKIGKALLFDGGASNEYVEVTNSTIDDISDDITVAAWVRFDASDFHNFVYKDPWGFQYQTDQALHFYTGIDIQCGCGSYISYGQWVFIVGTFDKDLASDQAKLYVNGVQRAQGTKTTAMATTTTNLGIGSDVAAGAVTNGAVDEVRIYNRALSATEVASLYSNSRGTKINSSANTRGPQNGLVGLWSFDGADISGTTAYDRSGSNNNGTLTNGPAVTKGKMGQALKFDGVDDYVSTATNLGANPWGGIFSYSLWFKTNISNGHPLIVVENSATGEASGDDDRIIYVGIDGKVYFVIYDTSAHQVASGGTVADNLWHHVVGVSNGSGISLYLDGQLQGSAGGGAFSSYGSSYVRFGSYKAFGSNSANGYYNGSIDDVRVYNRALSQAEVQELYALGGGTTVNKAIADPLASNLVLWHTFDGSKLNTTTSTDSSTSGANATLTNGPSPAKGKLGQALNFDGVNDVVVVASSSALQLTSNFTVSAWIYRTGQTGTDEIVLRRAITANFNTYSQYALQITNAGAPDVYLQGDTISCRVISNGEWPFSTLNTWHHYVVTVSATKQVTIYADNVVNQTADCSTVDSGTTTNTTIGAFGITGTSLPFKGSIDDVRIYNKALSAAEVSRLYNATK